MGSDVASRTFVSSCDRPSALRGEQATMDRMQHQTHSLDKIELHGLLSKEHVLENAVRIRVVVNEL